MIPGKNALRPVDFLVVSIEIALRGPSRAGRGLEVLSVRGVLCRFSAWSERVLKVQTWPVRWIRELQRTAMGRGVSGEFSSGKSGRSKIQRPVMIVVSARVCVVEFDTSANRGVLTERFRIGFVDRL